MNASFRSSNAFIRRNDTRAGRFTGSSSADGARWDRVFTIPGAQRVMSLAALRGMWSTPGPGGTLDVELIGAGVSWQLRPTAEGVVVVNHGGDLPGYHPYLMLVPAQQYVARFAGTFKEYPPRQKAASFSVDQILDKLRENTGGQ